MLVILPRLNCTPGYLGGSLRKGYPLEIMVVTTTHLTQGRFTSSDYWFNQMYYGTHGPFKRAQAGQAITFENDKVRTNGFCAQPRGLEHNTDEANIRGGGKNRSRRL